jgi:hypothetical protein
MGFIIIFFLWCDSPTKLCHLHYIQQTQGMNIRSLSRIRTCDPSNQAATDLRPRLHSHWDWLIIWRICKIANVAINFVMSVRMEQLFFHWTDFYEISYLSVFQKRVEKIQVS